MRDFISQHIQMNNNKIRKVLFNEISLISGVVAIAISITLFIVGPNVKIEKDIALIQQDIMTIKNNDLVHIQDSINSNTIRANSNLELITEINLKLERILTILED